MGMESFDITTTFRGGRASFVEVMSELGATAVTPGTIERALYWEIVLPEYIIEVQFMEIDGDSGRASARMAVCCDPAGLTRMLDVVREIAERFDAPCWNVMGWPVHVDVARPDAPALIAEQFQLKRKRLLDSIGLRDAPVAARRCDSECLAYLHSLKE